MTTFHVYILACSDDSFYVGHTDGLEERLRSHNAGRGGRYTKRRRPVRLMYSESFPSRAEAAGRELQLKKWSRAKKEALVAEDLNELKRLAQRRTP